MADIKISQLTSASQVVDTDVIPMTSGAVSVKAPASKLKEYVIGETNISSIGDGSVTNAIYELNSNKQNALTFDNIPTSGSNNPVKSGGIYSALSNKADVDVFNSLGLSVVNGQVCQTYTITTP